jgi:hypothetical protein
MSRFFVMSSSVGTGRSGTSFAGAQAQKSGGGSALVCGVIDGH